MVEKSTLMQWNDRIDRGYVECSEYPGHETVYNDSYIEKYKEYSVTEFSKKLNEFRVNIVKAWGIRAVLDVGVGDGTFLNTWGNLGYGYDVNPSMVLELQSNYRWFNPYEMELKDLTFYTPICVTFWDSLEHIRCPETLLNRFPKDTYVVVSIPIFQNKYHALRSKHFRPDEHYHYFTHKSFITYMEHLGFNCLECSDYETVLGRDEIYTFVFQKVR